MIGKRKSLCNLTSLLRLRHVALDFNFTGDASKRNILVANKAENNGDQCQNCRRVK